MRVERAGGVATTWRCTADAEAVPGAGFRAALVDSVEFGRDVGAAAAPLELGWISPAAAGTLFVNDEIAQLVHEAASLGCGVLIRGVFEFVVSTALGGGNTVSGIVNANLRTFERYVSMVLLAWSRMSFSLSIKLEHRAGRILLAQSSSLKESDVTASAINAAFLA